ncbi:MAG TPA: hypothetical protein VI039_08445 [Solirubrobacterales bacterium]
MRGSVSERAVAGLGGKSAFERNLLPGFAEWILEQFDRWQPDYLVPAETKGARVLDAALSFARLELGERTAAPVLYGSALSYIPPEELRDARVMIVDDAVRTGSNLWRHWQQIAGHRVEEIEALACIGCEPGTGRRPEVACYLHAEPELYQRYVWQLTELVVARGLPPEVDHFLLELQLGDRLAVSWPALLDALSAYGVLTIDGPATHAEQIQPATLHFPRLPGAASHPPEVGDGAYKVRFFPDLETERIYVVPISLPTLALQGAEPGAQISSADGIEALTAELGFLPPVGEVLVERAFDLDPKTLFRAVSAAREVEMIDGLSQVLGECMPDSILKPQTEVCERLFGPDVGALVNEAVAGALEAPVEPERHFAEGADPHPEPRLYLDADVEAATHGVAQELKRLYDKAASDPGHDPGARVGCSMSELAALLQGEDPLLASRCVDRGLALTTLVPYIDEVPGDGGSLLVQRRYRVSENNRGSDRSYLSLDSIRQEKSEEAIALICKRLREAPIEDYRERPIPQALIASIVAILRPLTFERQAIALQALPTPGPGLELALLDAVSPVPPEQQSSGHFKVKDDGAVVPTAGFVVRYDAEDLELDLDGCTEELEENLDKIIDLIKGLEGPERKKLLDGWAMSTDRRLGLSHVRRSLEQALDVLRRPLNLIRAGELHERTPEIVERVSSATGAARGKLELQADDWAAPARRAIPQARSRAQGRTLRSLAAAEKPGEIYGFATVLARLIDGLATVVDRLDAASAKGWVEEDGEEQRQTAFETLEWAAAIRSALGSFSQDQTPAVELPADPREAILAAAEEVRDLLELLAATAAALAGAYCGPKGKRLPSPHAEDARHAAILYLDVDGSTAKGELLDARTNRRWLNEGLNLAAQWTRVFGGYEYSDRKGDELVAEFAEGDRAALAAAAVLHHTAALRSTGIDNLSWTFHSGFDCGEVDDEDGGNLIGSPINRAAKLAKCLEGADQLERVPAGEEGMRHCSTPLGQEPLSEPGSEVEVGGRRLRPQLISSEKTIQHLIAGLNELAGRLNADVGGAAELERTLNAEERPASEAPAAEAAG